MKKVIFGIICLFMASQLFISCSSESDILSQFSKRKYLKKVKDKNTKYEDNIDKHTEYKQNNSYSDDYATASVDVKLSDYELEEIVAIDHSSMIIIDEERPELSMSIKELKNDYTHWSLYNRNMDLSTPYLNSSINNIDYQMNKSSQVNEIVLIILCIFIPPLAVYLYEDSITTNFWVDLIATLLFWLPGMIFAFLVCFAGVSL